ncbi:ABC transporter substrate-binding protein [Amphibacillus sp. Q70]|uniref:ABC transporter substrate-binding protein n=1 Tax=Amphibacillus sp. Q70 TaxID=3453416 RepID=UPI003F85AB9D
MKKALISFLLLVGILVLAACSGSGDDTDTQGDTGETDVDDTEETAGDEVELTAWAWDQVFNVAAIETASDYYDGEQDISLDVIENAQDDIIQRLNTGLSSGSTSGLPNIVLIEDYRAQSFLQAYPDMFYPITDYFNQDDFADYKMATTGYDGEQYGLPFDSGVAGLYVRTDILEEAGLSLEDVTNITWEEYIEVGEVIKEETGTDLLTLDPNDLGQIRMMIQSVGSWYVEEDGVTPDLANNEALAKAFENYKGLMEADVVTLVSDWAQFLAAFNDGDVATIPTGNWITASVKAEEAQSGDWAVVPIPRLDIEESVNASNLGGSSWYVLDLEGKEAAAEFLANTFGSKVDLYDELVTEIGAIGTYIPATESEAYESEDEYFDGQSIIADFSEWTEEIPGVNYGMHTYAIEDIIVVEMQNYLGGQDLSDVLNNAQEQAETQLR